MRKKNIDTMHLVYFVVSFVILMLWLYFIYGMSAKTGEESAGISYRLAACLYKVSFMIKLRFNTFHTLIRKTAHFTEYGILELLLLNLIHACGRKISKSMFVCTIFFCCLYAALDEYHQSFIAGRGASIIDVCIDTAGAIFFLIILFVVRTIR